MSTKYPILILLLLFSAGAYCQTGYWQQEVNYQIEVTLNDTTNELNGFITIAYSNNSPDTLHYIYLHLWPNAYKDQTTPFAKQLLQNGNTSFWFSKPSEHGYIDKLDLKLNAETCEWKYDSVCDDICKVMLNTPLLTGSKVKISTPFHVKLPETFSRLGHVGQSYQISQWYPKPAVYDNTGWHPLHYLDQGEFYSEFGNYDVSITLPENYVVGATGDLQDTAEVNWMNDKARSTLYNIDQLKNGGEMKFPASSTKTKTLHYKQSNVHDFGWFADKRYHVLKGEVELPVSKRKVITWALFTNSQAKYWQEVISYMHDAVFYYSRWTGDYPYAQVTAVDGTISAGGGMEYPNVTIIGQVRNAVELDEVITHEIGHNWFYGVLGSNERDHAWMDEGINSYYENRYIKRKYPDRRMTTSLLSDPLAKLFYVYQYKPKYLMDLGYQLVARDNEDQALEQTSGAFTSYNYAAIVYGKSALIFDYLEAYLGTRKFDSIMQLYYQQWGFKHPQPKDIRAVFEQETGKDLSWFFTDLIGTNKKVDYKIVSAWKNNDHMAPSSVTIKNVNSVSSPVNISLLKKDSIIYSTWVDGFTGSKKIDLPVNNADKVQIDPQLIMPEVNRKNNTYKFNRLAHRLEKLRFQFLGLVEDQQRTQICFAPYLGWNNYDKTQVGLVLYSPSVPGRKFSYIFTPAFGTGSKQFIGFGKVNYNFYPTKVQRVSIGINAKRFSYLLFPTNQTMNKIEPYIHIRFRKKDLRSSFNQSIHVRAPTIWVGIDSTNIVTRFSDRNFKGNRSYTIGEAKYVFERNSILNPFTVMATYQQGRNFTNLSVEGNFKISYKGKNQGLSIRLFASGYPWYKRADGDFTTLPWVETYLSSATAAMGDYYYRQKDYMFDENYLDRNGRNNYLGRQVSTSGGGFYSVMVPDWGATTKFMGATNISSSIYRYIPIDPFASFALSMDGSGNQMHLFAEAGLSLVLIRHVLEFHFPLLQTKNIVEDQKVLNITKWYQRITFTLKLQLPDASFRQRKLAEL